MNIFFIVVLLFALGFFVFRPLMERIGKTGTPTGFCTTCAIVLLPIGLLLLKAGLQAELWPLALFGAILALGGLALLYPLARKLVLALVLPRTGVRVVATVTGHSTYGKLGSRIRGGKVVDLPFVQVDAPETEYNPEIFFAKSGELEFRFFYPKAWRDPDALIGEQVIVFYRAGKPSVFHVSTKPLRSLDFSDQD